MAPDVKPEVSYCTNGRCYSALFLPLRIRLPLWGDGFTSCPGAWCHVTDLGMTQDGGARLARTPAVGSRGGADKAEVRREAMDGEAPLCSFGEESETGGACSLELLATVAGALWSAGLARAAAR